MRQRKLDLTKYTELTTDGKSVPAEREESLQLRSLICSSEMVAADYSDLALTLRPCH